MNSKTIQKYQKKTLPNLSVTAQKVFNECVRLRDTDDNGNGNCISNPEVTLKFGTANCQAGHFISAGSCPRLRFDERNVHLQSKSDNYFKSGNLLEYRRYLIKKIGEDQVKELEQISLNKKPFKWDRFELIEIIETYKAKSKELRKQKMF